MSTAKARRRELMQNAWHCIASQCALSNKSITRTRHKSARTSTSLRMIMCLLCQLAHASAHGVRVNMSVPRGDRNLSTISPRGGGDLNCTFLRFLHFADSSNKNAKSRQVQREFLLLLFCCRQHVRCACGGNCIRQNASAPAPARH